jgi:hypothetical protein
MLTAPLPKKLPDFLIATINKLLFCFQRGKKRAGLKLIFWMGLILVEHIFILLGYTP